MKNNNELIEVLIEEAFRENKRRMDALEAELTKKNQEISDLKTLVSLMDKRLDEIALRLKSIEDGKKLTENTFYNTYKNGDEE